MNLARLILQILSDFDLEYVSRLKKDRDGEIDFNNRVIRIRYNLPAYRKNHVLLHEIAHVYYDLYTNTEATEEEVDALAKAWISRIYSDLDYTKEEKQ